MPIGYEHVGNTIYLIKKCLIEVNLIDIIKLKALCTLNVDK